MNNLVTSSKADVIKYLHNEPDINCMLISYLLNLSNKDVGYYSFEEDNELSTVVITRQNKAFLYAHNGLINLSTEFINNFKYINSKHDISSYNTQSYKYRNLIYMKFDKPIPNVENTKIERLGVDELEEYYYFLKNITEVDLIKQENKNLYINTLKKDINRKLLKIYVIRKQNEIISAIQIVGENDFGAMIKGVATSKNHRNQGIAKSLLSSITKKYYQKNKNMYLFVEGEKLKTFYENIGFKKIDSWNMLVRK